MLLRLPFVLNAVLRLLLRAGLQLLPVSILLQTLAHLPVSVMPVPCAASGSGA